MPTPPAPPTPPLSPHIQGALAAVNEQAFVLCDHGTLVPQSSAPHIIAAMLDLLDLHPGMRVLEIGTGSGYSTALLAHVVGPAGHITSLDVVADLVTHATGRLAAHGYRNTTVLYADGANGAPTDPPYDRVIAWTTAATLPAAWVAQTLPGGVIVAPIALTTLATTGAGLVIDIDSTGKPVARTLFPAGFVAMHAEEVTEFLVPPYGVDALHRDLHGNPWWLSGKHLRGTYGCTPAADADAVLSTLIHHSTAQAGPLASDESVSAFHAWLLARQPPGLTTAALGEPVWRIGHTAGRSAALVNTRDGTNTTTTPDTTSLNALHQWVDHWRAAGRPGLHQLHPTLYPADTGWHARATPNAANAGARHGR